MSEMSSVGPAREFAIQAPVILFGHGRSGTSIIAALMREHLGVAFGTESQFILSYYDQINSFQPLQDDQNLKRLIDLLLSERWFQRSRKFRDFSLTTEQVFSAVKDRSYAGVLDAVFSLFAEHLDLRRWGDKTPAYIGRLDIIERLFPDAQYVYVVRDGRDVALSLKHIHFGPKNIYTAAYDWRETVRKGDAFAETLPPERLCYIRYEDFLDDPVETFMKLAGFLKILEPADSLRQDLEQSLKPKIKEGNSDKWRRKYSERQRATYERIAYNELCKHNYETIVEQPGKPTGPVPHYFWHALSELGRWRFKDYWKDNLYKTKLKWNRLKSAKGSCPSDV